ncbi:MAG: helix-turn-helix domain-containing protein [Novosphingobium sp.]|nr:helix-turn-helix domain-containing protein [Novosphingobium sp.]MCP5401857.1 helix-turn-helix domain-containing protein [Novosphingobium sp.]
MSLVAIDAPFGHLAKVRVERPSDKRSLSRSATRALDVLEFFGEVRRPLRAIEVSKMLGMQPSTTNQLLKTMVDSGHLVFEARTKTYLPSPRLVGFSGWLVDTFGAGEELRGLMKDVQKATGQVVTLTTPNDLFMQIVDLATPADRPTERGLRIAVFGSAIGSAYLATLETAEIERLAHRARIPDEEMASVFEAIDQIRRDGYADGKSAGDDLWSIAMAVPQTETSIPMVLGIAGPLHEVRGKFEEIIETMRQAIAGRFG